MTATRKPVTSQQVAQRAGVSRTTVSFVLNEVKNTSISQETRQRVLDAAAELGYVPNAAARSLARGETLTIGLVASRAEHLQVDAFIPQLLYSLSYYSHQQGYRVLLETVEDVSEPDTYLHLVRSQQIDGLIALNTRSDDTQLPELIRRNFPVVLLGFPQQSVLGKRVYIVESNNERAAKRATEHLLALGHTRIGHITFSPEQYHATQDRHKGYRQALEASGTGYDPRLVTYGNYSAESGYLAMKQLLKRKPRLSALFAGNDTIALGAMAAIHEAKLRIPEDIAIVGYDDIPTAPYLRPALTTVRVSAVEHGRIAVELLSKLMRGEIPPQPHIELETKLIVRESCGAKQRQQP